VLYNLILVRTDWRLSLSDPLYVVRKKFVKWITLWEYVCNRFYGKFI